MEGFVFFSKKGGRRETLLQRLLLSYSRHGNEGVADRERAFSGRVLTSYPVGFMLVQGAVPER